MPQTINDTFGIPIDESRKCRLPGLGGKIVETHLTDRHRPRVMWFDIFEVDRPAAMRNSGASLKVDRIKRPAVTIPMVGRAAEKA